MNAKELRAFITQFAASAKIVVVSNRELWVHERVARPGLSPLPKLEEAP